MISVLGITQKINEEDTYFCFFSNGKELQFVLTYEGDILPKAIRAKYKELISKKIKLPFHKRRQYKIERTKEMIKEGYSHKQICRELGMSQAALSSYIHYNSIKK